MQLKVVPVYDPDFIPMIKYVEEYEQAVASSEKQPIAVSVERNKGYVHTVKMDIFKDGTRDQDNFRVVERLVKTLLWVYGGWKITISGSRPVYEHLAKTYAKDGARAFDNDFMSGVYETEFAVEYIPDVNAAPATNESSAPVGKGVRRDRRAERVQRGDSVAAQAADRPRLPLQRHQERHAQGGGAHAPGG